MFQSTHPHGVRPQRLVNCFPFIGFNPRTRTGCDSSAFFSQFPGLCFNPRTRTGCDSLYANYPRFRSVSIHAPARGATRPSAVPMLVSRVSIHAPARGATKLNTRSIGTSGFQSTHPHGVRLCNPNVSKNFLPFQSTHPHGVRLAAFKLSFVWYWVSIHAPARGATRFSQIHWLVPKVSIHAPARGATSGDTKQSVRQSVSIHAPARGATTG